MPPSIPTPQSRRRRRRWLIVGGIASLAVVLTVAGVLATSQMSAQLQAGSQGIQRSLGQALTRGERDGQRVVVELSSARLTEIISEGLQGAGAGVEGLDVSVVPGERPDRGSLQVSGEVGEDGRFSGRAALRMAGGRLQVTMTSFDLEGYALPGMAQSAAGALVADAAKVEPYLAERGLRLADVAFTENLMRIVAVPRDGQAGGRAGAAGDGDGDGQRGDPAAQRYGPAPDPWPVPSGDVDRPRVAGEPTVLVIGDSVAAGVGVDDFAHSYAAQLHGWLQRRDGADYGLTDLARPGETSWSLREEGQLDRALDVLADTEVALTVVDIGANDVLSALEHPACADGITTARCHALVDGRLDDFRARFDGILGDLRETAPWTPLLVVTTYNPFSFGAETTFEQRSDEVVSTLNGIVSEVARRHDAHVADGAAPLRGRAGDLTHMGGEGAPDVHPTAQGYDALTQALIDALVRGAPPPRPQPSAP